MKKVLLKSITALCCLSLLILYLSSCKKDLLLQEQISSRKLITNSSNLSDNSIRQEFSSQNAGNYLIIKINDTLGVKWSPNWEKIIRVKKDTSNFLYIQIKPTLFNSKTGKEYLERNYVTISTSRYLMATKDYQNKTTFWWADFVQESIVVNNKLVNTKIDFKHFTGNLIVKSLDRKTFKYYVYKDGTKLTPSKIIQTVKTNGWEPECRDIYNCTYYCSCSGEDATDTYEYQTVNPYYCYVPPPPSSQCDESYEEWFLIDSYVTQQCTMVWIPDPEAPPGDNPDDYDPIVNDPCDANKTYTKAVMAQFISNNTSIAASITQTKQYANQGSESAFRVDNVLGVKTASTPVPAPNVGDPYSLASINSHTVAIGHGHDASSFPQPSYFDVYACGELAVSSGGNISLDMVISPTTEYALYVVDRTMFNNFLAANPESNLQKDQSGKYTGDLDGLKDVGRQIDLVHLNATSVYLSQHSVDPNNPTDAELKVAEVAGNEVALLFFLSNFKTGIILLKRSTTINEFVPLHVTQNFINGQTMYLSAPCN